MPSRDALLAVRNIDPTAIRFNTRRSSACARRARSSRARSREAYKDGSPAVTRGLRRLREVIGERAAGTFPVHREIAAVHCDHVEQIQSLADRDERCVGKVHRLVPVDQATHACKVRLAQIFHAQSRSDTRGRRGPFQSFP